MKQCPTCSNHYPDPFQYCPVDGTQLQAGEGEVDSMIPAVLEPAHISIRSLMLGVGTLLLAATLAFASVFFYQYLKPKYGGLVVKTTPAGAQIFIDGKLRGTSPVTLGDIRSGGHQVKATREGYKVFVQQVEVMPYAADSLYWTLEPLVPHLTNEQLAEVESWRKKLDTAQKENILLPPPDDYNVLYFLNKILAIDPANAYALEVRTKLSETVRRSADLAYAREDWLEAEKQYKNLVLLFPNDVPINERLTDITAKIDASIKDREKQIEDWKNKAEAALKTGVLVPPEKDNALDAFRNIQRLDKKSAYAREGLVRVKETLQNHGDTKIGAGDWQGSRSDFRLVLQYFPDDPYSKSRLAVVEAKLAEVAQAEQQRLQKTQEEQQSRQKIVNLRQSALNSYRSGAYEKSISEWQEYLKVEPNSDETYFYIGASYLEQKQLDTAILNFEKSLSLNPGNALAHANLGILYDRHRNDLALAVEHLLKAKELGGAEKYSTERLQALIQDIQDREQLTLMQKQPFLVEHKHAFSSCRGNLRVTDEGLEYKTTETDHSFFDAFKTLRSFTVLGDEISLRNQNSKKYNFHLLNPGDGERLRRVVSRHTQVTS